MDDTLRTCHPAVSFAYFALVIACAMLLMHPVCLVLSTLGGGWYVARLLGGKGLRRHLLQKLAQVHGVQLRLFIRTQKLQQRHGLAEGAVQLRGSGNSVAALVGNSNGSLVRTGAAKMLFQIFTVAPDQRQRTEADLLDPLLLICRNRPRFCPFLLHCSASPGDAIFSGEHHSVPGTAAVCKPYGRRSRGETPAFCRNTTSLTA